MKKYFGPDQLNKVITGPQLKLWYLRPACNILLIGGFSHILLTSSGVCHKNKFNSILHDSFGMALIIERSNSCLHFILHTACSVDNVMRSLLLFILLIHDDIKCGPAAILQIMIIINHNILILGMIIMKQNLFTTIWKHVFVDIPDDFNAFVFVLGFI